jgi:hypothetical protein
MSLLNLMSRERVPLQWAATQNNLVGRIIVTSAGRRAADQTHLAGDHGNRAAATEPLAHGSYGGSSTLQGLLCLCKDYGIKDDAGRRQQT